MSGIHWTYQPKIHGTLHVQVPNQFDPRWKAARELLVDPYGQIPDSNRDELRDALRQLWGRDGTEPVERVSIEVKAKFLPEQHDLGIYLDGIRIVYGGQHESWTKPRADVRVSGHDFTFEGEGESKRIVFTDYTTVYIEDVPVTALAQLTGQFRVLSTRNDEAHDPLLREASRLLGVSYYSDIPPVPGDAKPTEVPLLKRDDIPHESIALNYPQLRGTPTIDLDARNGQIRVRRMDDPTYLLDLTEERRDLLSRLDAAFGFSPVAYAAMGVQDPAAIEYLAARGMRAHELRSWTVLFAVRDLADAEALLSRTSQEWEAAGWAAHSHGTFGRQPYYEPWSTAYCIRARDAKQLADAGMRSWRAYELRELGHTSAQGIIDADVTTINHCGRDALGLVETGGFTHLRELAATMRTHTTAETGAAEDGQDFGAHGWKVSKSCQIFTNAAGETLKLWVVYTTYYQRYPDGDVRDEMSVHLDAKSANDAYDRARREGREPYIPPTPRDDSCPGKDVRHCDSCGAEAPNNEWLSTLGWMAASLGTACSIACYDAMSNDPGKHAMRFHQDW